MKIDFLKIEKVFDKLYLALNKYFPYIIFSLFFLYLLPFFIFGSNSYITIHDILDSVVPWYKVLTNSHQLFSIHSFSPVFPIMNGIPRGFMITGFNLYAIIFSLFPSFWGYAINDLLMHLIAFLGMFLLLKRYVLKKKDNIILFGVSFAFAILPFYNIFGISIAGLPLIIFAFYNILNNKIRYYDCVIVFLYPFYSYFFFIAPFLIILLVIIYIKNIIDKKNINIKFLIFLFIMILFYALAEINFLKLFFKHIPINRMEFNPFYKSLSFLKGIYKGIHLFLYGQYHANPANYFIAIFILPITILMGILKKDNLKEIFYLLLSIIFISLFYGLWKYTGFIKIKEHIPLLKMFQWDRFYFLLPFLWYFLLAFLLLEIKKIKFGKFLIIIFLTVQILFILKHNKERVYTLKFNLFSNAGNRMNYKDYFSQKLFDEINNFINKPKNSYRIINIGIQPAIAQYNGFCTLGSYQNLYLLSYKKSFRKIIEKELDKNKKWREYFDYWGNRCYVFSSELNKLQYLKNENKKIYNLELNIPLLKKLNCQYIFSAVKIVNYKNLDLKFLKKFETKDSPWRIYLYKI